LKTDELNLFFHKGAFAWTQHGDHGTSAFFKSTSPRNISTFPTALLCPNCSLTLDLNKMRNFTTNFYKQLLLGEMPNYEALVCGHKFWNSLKPVLSLDINSILLLSLSNDELLDALKALPQHSCPCEDGLLSNIFLNIGT
jgi:hypothetical protein